MDKSDEWKVTDTIEYRDWEFFSGRGLDLEQVVKKLNGARLELNRLRRSKADKKDIELAKSKVENADAAVSDMRTTLVKEFLSFNARKQRNAKAKST